MSKFGADKFSYICVMLKFFVCISEFAVPRSREELVAFVATMPGDCRR